MQCTASTNLSRVVLLVFRSPLAFGTEQADTEAAAAELAAELLRSASSFAACFATSFFSFGVKRAHSEAGMAAGLTEPLRGL